MEVTMKYILKAAAVLSSSFGKYLNGGFISIPAFGIGCDPAGYSDYFWNNEHLSRLMNPVDAATVAETLRTLSKNKCI